MSIEKLQASIAAKRQYIAKLEEHQMYSDGASARHSYDRQIVSETASLNKMVDELLNLQRLQNEAPDFDDDAPDFDPAPAVVSANEKQKTGIFYGMSNEEYHSGPGISKSGLDYIATNPSNYIWQRSAPVDADKLDAMDMGSALHCMLLEPDEFSSRFVTAPDADMRTNSGKAKMAEFIEEHKKPGVTILDFEQMRKLRIMFDSAMSHPVVKMIFEAEGYNEASIYWIDKETGELCRVRPDRVIKCDGRPVIVDVKKVAGLDRFANNVHEHRYPVQQAMYQDGFKNHFGHDADFWFLQVSDVINAGRYPVTVEELPQDWVNDGFDLYRKNLLTYHQCKQNDDWLHVPKITRPRWAY